MLRFLFDYCGHIFFDSKVVGDGYHLFVDIPEKSYFDQQQAQLEGANEEPDEEIEIPTIPADPDVQDAHCEICQDRFEQFYNEEKEEWQLRMAMRVNDKTYHPLCYEDYQVHLVHHFKQFLCFISVNFVSGIIKHSNRYFSN